MTDEDLKEWGIIYGTRMGILCPDGNDTASARKIAEDEANEWLERMKQYDLP